MTIVFVIVSCVIVYGNVVFMLIYNNNLPGNHTNYLISNYYYRDFPVVRVQAGLAR